MDRQFIKLKPHISRKQYSHNKTFGVSAAPLPDELLFLTPVLNQGLNEECTAYGICAIRTGMTNHVYDPEGQWAQELQFTGQKDAQNGMSFEVPFAVGVKVGFMPQGQPLPIDKATSYFFVYKNGGKDLFDSIRQAIYTAQCPLGVGIDWYSSYDTGAQGIVPNFSNNLLGGHFIKIAGWKTINGIPYLTVQNSWGENAPGSDGGLYYFGREIVNRVFGQYGIAYLSDNQDTQVQTLGLILATYQQIKSLLLTILIKFGFSL